MPSGASLTLVPGQEDLGRGRGGEYTYVCVCMSVCSHSAEDYFPFETLFRKLQSQVK